MSSINRIAEVLGRETFNKLIASLPETRAKGRLRYWQEKLFVWLEVETGIRIASLQDFCRLFESAKPIPIPRGPISKEEFLHEIERWPHSGFPLDEVPPEWMAEAWKIDRVREEISYSFKRDVSKVGEICFTKEYLDFLAKALSVNEQVELYSYIRDSECALREAEFRPGFERAFPEATPFLPALRTHAEQIQYLQLDEST